MFQFDLTTSRYEETQPLRVMVTGKLRRGKDTLAALLRELRPNAERIAFADALKREVADMLNHQIEDKYIPHNGYYAGREFSQRGELAALWQWYGAWIRSVDEDYWVRRLAAQVKGNKSYVVTDYRYPNEAKYGLEHGFTLVRVTGPLRGNAEGRDENHESERHIDTLPAHLEFRNDGSLEYMRCWVEEMLIPAATERCRKAA